MRRRDFLSLLAATGAVAAVPFAGSDLQARLDDAGDAPVTLPPGRHVVTRTLRVGPGGLRGSRGTVLVAGPGLRGPVLTGDAPFELRALVVEGAVRTTVGARGGRFLQVG